MTTIFDPGYNLLSAPQKAYVFLLVDGTWKPVGLIQVSSQKEGWPYYSFGYGKSWRERVNTFALDPVNLPLGNTVYSQTRMFGVLQDAGPDRWGARLLREQFALLQEQALDDFRQGGGVASIRRRMMTDIDTLLLTGDDRVGALAFGVNSKKPLTRTHPRSIRDLSDLETALMRVDAGLSTDKDIAFLANGASLGGARPKTTIKKPDGSMWLAKFQRKSDAVDMVRSEHAMMTLAAAAGIKVAETEVASLGANREALLVRRFDRQGEDIRLPFLSAMSLTGYNDTDIGGSYQEIADKMRVLQHQDLSSGLKELYRRLIFNCVMGNTDDHLKNHGFLRDQGMWKLAPAYDAAPHIDGGELQAISVGKIGAAASYENVVSDCGRFGVTTEDAAHIISEVLEMTSGWRQHFAARGVDDADIRVIGRHCVDRVTLPNHPDHGNGFRL